MGFSVQSTQLQQAINEVNTAMTKVTSNYKSNNSANCSAINSIKYDFGGKGCPPVGKQPGLIVYGDVNIKTFQDATTNCTLNSQTINVSGVDLQTLVTQTASALSSASQTTLQDFLATATNLQAIGIKTTEDLVTRINNDIKNNTTVTCNNISTSGNTLSLGVCGWYFGNYTLDPTQDAEATAMAGCYTSSIFNVISNDSTLQAAFEKDDAAQAAKQQGLSSLFTWIIWLIGGIIAIIVIGGLLFLLVAALRPKNKGSSETPAVSGINASAQEKLVNQFLQHPELL